MRKIASCVFITLLLCSGCAVIDNMGSGIEGGGTYGSDVTFMKKHVDVVELSNSDGNVKVAIVPAYQGRVMTSTARGDSGASFGWINRPHIAAGEFVEHINVFGGEDRFWMGPEGGQYAIFFPPDAPFDREHWQTPPFIDTVPYDLASKTSTRCLFRNSTTVTNRHGTEFKLQIERMIRLLDTLRAQELLGVEIPAGVDMVAYESYNKIYNDGDTAWSKDSGLLSIWILGMYAPSDATTVVIPFEPGPESERGPFVNDEYFGKVPPDRLVVRDNVLFFRGDGQYRSKIGLGPKRAKPTIGSYDADGKVLTLVNYTKTDDAEDYVNSMWEMQEQPYAGDVVNSYNDGPPAPGKKPLGPFYELETSSAALILKPGMDGSHSHRTFHLQGDEADLDNIAQSTLGVALSDIKSVFGSSGN